MATVKIEGQTLQLDDAICKNNKSLTDALLPFFPAVANAEIKRETKDEETTITVTKKAGTKGLVPVLAALHEAPETVSTILLLEASGRSQISKIVMDEAILQMIEDEAEIQTLTRTLDQATSEPARRIPPGF